MISKYRVRLWRCVIESQIAVATYRRLALTTEVRAPSHQSEHAHVHASRPQVYNDGLNDLLAFPKKLGLKLVEGKKGAVVQDLTNTPVKTDEEVYYE